MTPQIKEFYEKMREGINLLSEASEIWEENEDITNFMLNNNIKYSVDLPSFDDLVSSLEMFVEAIEENISK